MCVLVVNIRKVRMPVRQHEMAMRMHMRLDTVPSELMVVAVMFVVNVGVGMV